MSYSIEGRVRSIGQLETFNNFKKIEFIIETTEEKYQQIIKFEVHNDKAEDAIKNLNSGDNVEVHFNLRGREWEGKVFNNLVAWKIKPVRISDTIKTESGVVDDNLPF